MPTTRKQSKKRKSPGTGGSGKFYRIEVRPKEKFATYRTQDVGKEGHLERVAGKRKDGTWDTATWLVEKKDAHVSGGKLVIDSKKARTALAQIKGPIKRAKGNVFRARPQPARKRSTAKKRR